MNLFTSGNKTILTDGNTPVIKIKSKLKKIEITGRSKMIDPDVFFDNLLKVCENSYHEFKKTLIIDLRLDYLNSSSSKYLYQILAYLQKLAENDGMIQVNWYYEEDDEIILEAGETLQSLFSFDFNLVKMK